MNKKHCPPPSPYYKNVFSESRKFWITKEKKRKKRKIYPWNFQPIGVNEFDTKQWIRQEYQKLLELEYVY